MNYSEVNIDVQTSIKIHNLLPKIGIDKAREEILKGLKSDPKYISPKYFYNREGSLLFEEITKLKEYYPTRSEKEILSSLIPILAFKLDDVDIIELGSGDASKISLIFDQIQEDTLKSINYFAIDIDRSAIEKSIQQITNCYNINCTGIITDFYQHLELMPSHRKRLFCFFGSTIGNFTTYEAETFLKKLGSIMRQGDALLLGADMVKDISIMEMAYNDDRKITEAFNKNILNTVNSLLESNFDSSDFEHLAFYNEHKSRIEMHLTALRELEIQTKYAFQSIKIEKGERLHTENSHKFNQDQLKAFGKTAELELEKSYFDSNNYFSLSYFLKH